MISLRAALAILVWLLVLPATQALAADCGSNSTQNDLDQCYGAAYEKADDELNNVYKEIAARLKGEPDTAKLLVTAQRAWVAFRDAECSFSTSAAAQGSIYPMVQAICLENLTAKRVEGLKVYLNCEEGDMSCPVPAP